MQAENDKGLRERKIEKKREREQAKNIKKQTENRHEYTEVQKSFAQQKHNVLFVQQVRLRACCIFT